MDNIEKVFDNLNEVLSKTHFDIYWGANEDNLPMTNIKDGVGPIKTKWCELSDFVRKIFPQFLPSFEGYSINPRVNFLKIISHPTIVEVFNVRSLITNFCIVRIVIVFMINENKGYIILCKVNNRSTYSTLEEAEKNLFSNVDIPNLTPVMKTNEGIFLISGMSTKAAR